MYKKWKNQGMCSEIELLELISKYEYQHYVAFQTDKFLAGSKEVESFERIEMKNLLELRCFSSESEFLARRTMIGKQNLFQWRIASEEAMEADEILEGYQTLDIDSRYTKKGQYGNLDLMTTGGGTYELPIDKSMTSMKIISYIGYAEDGMAYVYDNRLVDFSRGGE